MIPLLQPIFQGDWAPLGEALVCSPAPPPHAIGVAELLREPHRLDAILRRHAQHLGVAGHDLRAAASSWSLAYLDVLLPPFVAAASVLQHKLPAHADELSVLLGDDAAPWAFHITHTGHPAPGADTATRFDPLIGAHLAALFAAISRQTRLAGKILWGNLARRLEGIFDQALRLTGDAAHVARDRDHLLHSAHWPDGRTNPLHGPQRLVAGYGALPAITLHRQCCLCYLLPGQDYCGACPLAPQHLPVKVSKPSA